MVVPMAVGTSEPTAGRVREYTPARVRPNCDSTVRLVSPEGFQVKAGAMKVRSSFMSPAGSSASRVSAVRR